MRISFIVVFFSLIMACSTAHKGPYNQTTKSPERIWSLAGKVSVKYNSGAFVSRFRWKQGRNSSQILFKNSFGQYIKLTIKNGLSVLENSKGTTVKNGSLKSLMAKELGWFFPLETVSSWIGRLLYSKGKSGKHTEYEDAFSGYENWKMVVEEFFPSDNLPRKLRFSSDEAEIKLIIKEWDFENGKID